MDIKKLDKRIILIAITIALVIVAMIYSLISNLLRPKEPELSQPILPPITFTDSRKVYFDDTVPYVGSSRNEIIIYRISTEEVLDRVRTFVDGAPVQLPFSTSGSSDLLWGDYTEDFIAYDELTGELSFYFEKYQLTLSDITESSGGNPELMKNLITRLNPDATYQDILTKNSFGNIRYETSRVLDGMPIEQGAIMENTDFIETTPSGIIIRGKIVVLEFIPELELPRTDIKQIGDLIDRGSIGIEYQEIVPPELTFSYWDSINTDDGYVESIPKADNVNTDYKTTQCQATSSTLIYYLRSVAQNYLYPVYKVNCMAQAENNGKLIDVPVIVYVNAVDLTAVKTPTQSN